MFSPQYSAYWDSLTANISGIYPWYDISDSEKYFTLNFNDLISKRETKGKKSFLDMVSVASKIYFPFFLSDRTLITDIKRSPWMSYLESNQWHKHTIPPHRSHIPEPKTFVNKIKITLLNEITRYIDGNNNIGILLSGGMDSRVLAGIIREYQNKIDSNIEVIGITWGNKNSRDVVYAQKITLQFDWTWKHIELSAETLYENIQIAAQSGAEVSAIHYHGIDIVSKMEGIDVVIAASYGDSIGRGEYSGKHLTELKDLSSQLNDKFSILKKDAVAQLIPQIKSELFDTSKISNPIRKKEIQQQQHYLRRMLQACMMHIAKSKKFYQIFTTPEIVSLMWSIDPKERNDQWYQLLLQELPGKLLNIPWARTGNYFGQKLNVKDGYDKNYHNYGKWLRGELQSVITEAVNSSSIRELDIFNHNSLDQSLSVWKKASTNSINYFDELFCWMASLRIFLEENKIEKMNRSYQDLWKDKLYSYQGRFYGETYIKLRNIRRS